jgi:hypothetical protein
MSSLAISAYDIGSFAGLATLAALLVALSVRVWRAAPAPSAAPATGGLAAEVTRPPAAGRRRRDVIALCVVAVWFAAAAGYAATKGGPSDDPWASAQGVNTRAGFLDGCQDSAGRLVDCGCVFDTLRSAPPFDTPDGFIAMVPAVQRASASGDPKLLPAAYVTAVRSCRR